MPYMQISSTCTGMVEETESGHGDCPAQYKVSGCGQKRLPQKPQETTADRQRPPYPLSDTGRPGDHRRQVETPIPSQQHRESTGDHWRETPMPSQQHQESTGDHWRQVETPVPSQRHQETTGDYWRQAGRDPRTLSATLGDQETTGDRQAETPVPSQQHQETTGDCWRHTETPWASVVEKANLTPHPTPHPLPKSLYI